ncbi:hypothetical protein BDN72DRAFT_809998 [Pluteus cervinus]|uniref:Uncharacterized protein n=1 Tax=Pluteus cervinus TaxID=181527 RepID=A0ACD3BDF8_9AGAR|nr:hypothetical protein BDN72DRAFT_809998 [Pluteus cervinus]
MSDLYANLVSPRKKRRAADFDSDDDNILTPKRLRIAPPTPPATVSRKPLKTSKATTSLPQHISRLCTIQNAIQQALSHALATCAVSPTSDTGIVRNVLNHLSLSTYAGLTTQFNTDDLKRLCWIWEWDGKALPKQARPSTSSEDENPFLDLPTAPTPSDWSRRGMGFVLSPTTHYSKSDRKRVPAYGIGIEVEMDIDKDMKDGMAAVARWTATGGDRNAEFRSKVGKWIKLHGEVIPAPQIPIADLPQLAVPTKISDLTRTLASASPKACFPKSTPEPPKSPSRSPSKLPVKRLEELRPIPFPSLGASPSKSPTKGTKIFPQTPSRHGRTATSAVTFPHTPSSPAKHASPAVTAPSTPVHQRGSGAVTAPQTPTTSRRQALYERVRMKSLTSSPMKGLGKDVGGKFTKDQLLKVSQEEMRRKCLLGRLDGVAESVWMLFSNPATGSIGTPSTRKRRAMPTSEVVTAVVKSSPVPISAAEASESLGMLTKLCPFFLKQLNVGSEEWLEMPAPTPANDVSPTKPGPSAPPSPGPSRTKDSALQLVTRSPKHIRREAGGLREVREIIRREVELQD